MRIYITPHEIVERALWYKYEYYALRDSNSKEISEILEKNEEFLLPEEDGLVIGLISTIETDNLIHRLNLHLLDVLSNKSTDFTNKQKKVLLVINKNAVEEELTRFLKNFPTIWKENAKLNYKKRYAELEIYVNDLLKKLENLETYQKDFQNITITYVQVTHVKKMLDRTHE